MRADRRARTQQRHRNDRAGIANIPLPCEMVRVRYDIRYLHSVAAEDRPAEQGIPCRPAAGTPAS